MFVNKTRSRIQRFCHEFYSYLQCWRLSFVEYAHNPKSTIYGMWNDCMVYTFIRFFGLWPILMVHLSILSFVFFSDAVDNRLSIFGVCTVYHRYSGYSLIGTWKREKLYTVHISSYTYYAHTVAFYQKKSCNEYRIISNEMSANFFDKYLHMFLVSVLVLGK